MGGAPQLHNVFYREWKIQQAELGQYGYLLGALLL
jgi:hypothetical protein